MRSALVKIDLICDLMEIFFLSFRSDPDKDTQGWGENDRGVSFTFGADVVAKVNQLNFFIDVFIDYF